MRTQAPGSSSPVELTSALCTVWLPRRCKRIRPPVRIDKPEATNFILGQTHFLAGHSSIVFLGEGSRQDLAGHPIADLFSNRLCVAGLPPNERVCRLEGAWQALHALKQPPK
jgi:hypothetical protein